MTRPPVGAVRALVIAAFCAASWNGCFFSPREPEDSQGGTITRWRQPNTPQILVDNIRFTFEDRQINFYRRSFRTDFDLVPDEIDSLNLAAISRLPFVNWGQAKEEEFGQAFFGSVHRIGLQLAQVQPPVFDVGPDTARVRLRYEMSVIDSTPPGGGAIPESSFYAGTLTFFMRDEGTGWGLYAWEDDREPDPDILSWTLLRANILE